MIGLNMNRHNDFIRIRNEFINYYKNEAKGDYEYYQWLNALHLDEGLCYSQTHESFQWAKDMLKTVGEDAENKYYKVLVAFPLESMNGNIYKEADLQEDARSVTKGHPSLNHKDEYLFCPESKWGAVYVTGAEYEDGAVEALLKVPKTTVCPVTGERLYTVIDQKRIVNVSLEGFTASNGRFHFNEQIPFTLLMNNVLPGIPLARIFPIETKLEAYLPGLKSSINRKIRIIGLDNKMKEEKTPNADLCPSCGKPLTDGKCSNPECKPKDEEAKSDNFNPIIPVVTNAGVNAKGPAIPDENDKKMIQGESIPELKVKALRAEQALITERKQFEEKEKSFELRQAETGLELQKAYSRISNLEGVNATHESTINRLEKQTESLNKEKVADAAEVKSLTRRLEDMTESRESYKCDFEALKQDKEKLEAKYRETLTNNLALEKKLTETNEEYLVVAKKSEQLEDKIKHVNRITKVTTKF